MNKVEQREPRGLKVLIEALDNVQVVGQLSYFRGNMHTTPPPPPTLITITAQFHPLLAARRTVVPLALAGSTSSQNGRAPTEEKPSNVRFDNHTLFYKLHVCTQQWKLLQTHTYVQDEAWAPTKVTGGWRVGARLVHCNI